MPFSCRKLTSSKVRHFICSKPQWKHERQKPQAFHVRVKLPQYLILTVFCFIIDQVNTEISFAEVNSFVCYECKEIVSSKFVPTFKKYVLLEKEQSTTLCSRKLGCLGSSGYCKYFPLARVFLQVVCNRCFLDIKNVQFFWYELRMLFFFKETEIVNSVEWI